MLDVLIRNGWLADGTGNPTYPADLGIHGDRIAAIGRLSDAQAQRVIDATDRIVCPGFVDADGHTDYTMFANPTLESTVRQGVTTEVVGGCGNSFAPVSTVSHQFIAGRLRELAYEGPVEWSSFADYLDAIAAMGTSGNFAFLVGHNALRYAAGVFEPKARSDQLRAMENYVREAMEAGALGLSSGLEFEPGRSAPTEELVELARVAAEYGGCYVSHIRNRDTHFQEAVDEFVEIVRRSTQRGQLQHLNVRYNTGADEGAWQRAVDTMGRARRDGLAILSDAFPFPFALGLMAGILPPWLFDEGVGRAAERLRDRGIRERLRVDCDRYWRFIHRGEWDRVRLQGSPQHPELNGKTFREIAALWGKDEWDCYFDVLAAAGVRLESVLMVGTLFTEEHLAEMIRHPLFCLSPDNWSSRIDGPLSEVTRHPLPYCGHVHFLTHHVRERGTLRLEEAIRKMTSMPASHFGLHDRGLLRPGCAADVVVFDFEALDDVSTWERPLAYARGVEHVLVNGVMVVDGGEHTGARPGRVLRRS